MDISDMIDWGSVTNLNHGAPPSHRLNTALHSQLEIDRWERFWNL